MMINIAEEACKYSRQCILAGSTLIDNNLFDKNKKFALSQLIIDIRNIINNTEFLLNIDTTVTRFQKSVFYCTKYSLGNCWEYTLLALYYVMVHYPDKLAEAYYIDGGEHAILVIGRQPDSDPSNPLTWGEDAVICDPWSNKTYRAQEYLSQLKNFYRTLSFFQGYINHTEDFNIRRHKLKPFLNYNSKYLKENSAQTLETLLKIYDCLYEKYLDIYNTFLNEIRKINKDIESKYGKNDPRYQSLILKIDSIQSIIDSCRNKALFEKAMIGENLIFVENMMNIQKTFKDRVGKIKN